MATFGLEFEGKEHNAVSDAKATLAVIRTMAQYGTIPATAGADCTGDLPVGDEVVTAAGAEC